MKTRIGREAAVPQPDDVREFRRARNLSATAAAALVHTSARSWMQWEAGDRRMHAAFWELARLKGGRARKVAVAA